MATNLSNISQLLQQAQQVAANMLQTVQKMGQQQKSLIPTPPTPVSLQSQTATQTTPSTRISSGVISSPQGYSQSLQQYSQPLNTQYSQPLNTQTSLVDYLKSKGMPSDFTSRSQLAAQLGIQDYRGTAEQNIQILKTLQQKEKQGTTQPTAQPQLTTSIQSQQPIISTQPEEPVLYTGLGDIDTKINNILDKYLQPIDYSQIAAKAKAIADEMNKPYIEVFNQMKDTLINQYELAKQDLIRNQQEEKEKMLGQWTTRGFSPSDPVVQNALAQLQNLHNQELIRLEQQKGEALAKLATSVSKTEPTEVAKIIASLMSEERAGMATALGFLQNLLEMEERKEEREMEASQPKYFTHETGVYQINPITGEVQQLIVFPTTDKITDIIQDESGQYYFVRESGRIEPLGISGAIKTGAMSEGASKLNSALGIISQVKGLLNEIGLADTPASSLIRGPQLEIEAKLKINPTAAAYKSLVEGTLSFLIKSLGEAGTLSAQDVARARKLLPTFFDTKDSAERKLNELETLITNALSVYQKQSTKKENDPLNIRNP